MVAAESADEAARAGLVDEEGYLPVGSTSPSKLVIARPAEPVDRKIEAMTEEQKRAHAGRNGTLVAGEPSAMTKALLTGLYGLTGAKVVRDDQAEGLTRGNVVREAEYMGDRVYFSERYDDKAPYVNDKVLSVLVMNAETGGMAVTEINERQLGEFAGIAGVELFEARGLIGRGGITSRNYREAAAALLSGERRR